MPAAGVALLADKADKFSWTTSLLVALSCRIQVSKVNTGWAVADGFTTGVTPTGNEVVNQFGGGLIGYTWAAGSAGTSLGPIAGGTYFFTDTAFSAASGTSSYSPVRRF